MYEKTGKLDGRLSLWNAQAVSVDKVENPGPVMTVAFLKLSLSCPHPYQRVIPESMAVIGLAHNTTDRSIWRRQFSSRSLNHAKNSMTVDLIYWLGMRMWGVGPGALHLPEDKASWITRNYAWAGFDRMKESKKVITRSSNRINASAGVAIWYLVKQIPHSLHHRPLFPFPSWDLTLTFFQSSLSLFSSYYRLCSYSDT